MDPIVNIQPVIIPTQTPTILSAPAAVVPDQTPPAVLADTADMADQASFNSQAAEQKRAEAVQQMAQNVANVYVVSDQRFTIFKDSTGQYITRFTSLRDGKVTYIPEPELFKLGGSGGGTAPLLKIQA